LRAPFFRSDGPYLRYVDPSSTYELDVGLGRFKRVEWKEWTCGNATHDFVWGLCLDATFEHYNVSRGALSLLWLVRHLC